MKYSGASIVTGKQVGATATVVENDATVTVNIVRTKSTKTGAGAVAVYYLTSQFPNRWFASTELYTDATTAKAGMASL